MKLDGDRSRLFLRLIHGALTSFRQPEEIAMIVEEMILAIYLVYYDILTDKNYL